MDFVPAHFCKDACSFCDFDGTPTFEYEERFACDQSDPKECPRAVKQTVFGG